MIDVHELFQNLSEVVDHIPVHIGFTELKNQLYNEIYSAWINWSKGFHINVDQLIMRNSGFGIMKPREPDRDIISENFFKITKKVPTFKSGQCLILFHVPDDIMNQCRRHQEEVDVHEAVSEHKNKSTPVIAAEFTVS